MLARGCLVSTLMLLAPLGQANVIQYFAGISYSNPADLFQTKKNTLILGETGFYADLFFHGQGLNFNTQGYDQGVSFSRRTSILPYGRIAKRVNDKVVVGVDVTEPFHSNLNWGDHSITRFASTQNYLTDVDVSPKFAFSLNDQWKVGAGVNFNFIKDNQVNWAMPISPTQYANLFNITSGFGVGYDLGVTYLYDKSNILGLTYYSRIRQDTRGYSKLAGFISNDLEFAFNMPATWVLGYLHVFNEKWLMNLKVFHVEWRANQYVKFINTAAQPAALFKDFTFTMQFENTFSYLAVVRRQMTEKLGLALMGFWDNGPEQDQFRPLAFPSYTQYVIGLGADYHINEQTTIELQYAHVFSNPPINNTLLVNGQNIPFTTGKLRINADVIDLKLKIEA